LELYEELKVFKDCTFREFLFIIGMDFNPSLPLYANLYILKEMMMFGRFFENEVTKYQVPGTILGNFAFYYGARWAMPGAPIKFVSIIRTLLIFWAYHINVGKTTMGSLCDKYRVNINHLFD